MHGHIHKVTYTMTLRVDWMSSTKLRTPASHNCFPRWIYFAVVVLFISGYMVSSPQRGICTGDDSQNPVAQKTPNGHSSEQSARGSKPRLSGTLSHRRLKKESVEAVAAVHGPVAYSVFRSRNAHGAKSKPANSDVKQTEPTALQNQTPLIHVQGLSLESRRFEDHRSDRNASSQRRIRREDSTATPGTSSADASWEVVS